MLVPDNTGASFTAVILIVLCTTLLKLFAAPPSFTTKLISRGVVDGLSLELLYLIARNAASNCAGVPLLSIELKTNTPVLAFKLAVMLPVLAFAVKVSASSLDTKLVIVTVALDKVALSTSDSEMPVLTNVAASFSV